MNFRAVLSLLGMSVTTISAFPANHHVTSSFTCPRRRMISWLHCLPNSVRHLCCVETKNSSRCIPCAASYSCAWRIISSCTMQHPTVRIVVHPLARICPNRQRMHTLSKSFTSMDSGELAASYSCQSCSTSRPADVQEQSRYGWKQTSSMCIHTEQDAHCHDASTDQRQCPCLTSPGSAPSPRLPADVFPCR